MATINVILPKMGESITDATILTWVKQVGDTIELDETIVEIATDKVDSEVPSPAAGVISEIRCSEGDVVPVGDIIAVITTEGSEETPAAPESEPIVEAKSEKVEAEPVVAAAAPALPTESTSDRFYSPLVRSMAKEEGIALSELDALVGSGQNNRFTKADMIAFIANRGSAPLAKAAPQQRVAAAAGSTTQSDINLSQYTSSSEGNVEIIQMDRMRKLIADHMVASKRISPHVTSFVEADMTPIFEWREKNKKAFLDKYGAKITFMPIIMEAITKAIGDFPMINSSVDGDKIIRKLDVNLGMATALPNNNLIVPVIKNADTLNLVGLAKAVSDLAGRARQNKLKPTEIQGGTFTLTNVGSFGNLSGVPIINQPQVAIMSVGAILKKPGVVETEYGDLIAVRRMMMISLSYDHRVVDGYLGGSFLRRVADYLEGFDTSRPI